MADSKSTPGESVRQLVERLRDESLSHPLDCDMTLFAKAADRIESLEAALAKLKKAMGGIQFHRALTEAK